MLPFRPINDVIICQRETAEERRASGIIVAIKAADRDEALVLGCGTGRRLTGARVRPMDVRVGERIVFPPTRGQAFTYHHKEYVAIREEHVIAKRAHGRAPLVPLNDFVIAHQLPTERINPGGRIVIPTTADDRDEATLLACGPGRVREDGTREAMSLRVGDLVLYNKNMGDHFRDGDHALVAFREEHVVCVTDRAPEPQAA